MRGPAARCAAGILFAPPPAVPRAGDAQHLGIRGEDLACRELRRRGYAILARRYRTRFGEIDIVSERGGVLVFVEVKARTHRRMGRASAAIPLWKRRRLAAMALDYQAWAGRLASRCRFDVVAIDGIDTERMSIDVIENAFWFDR
jgi:putative endonuclease